MNKIKNFFSDWTVFEKSWLVISVLIITALSILWKEKPIALISGISGIISVVLSAKGKLLNYAFGAFQAITYAYICFQANIYGEVMYNILMIPMIIIGVITWKKNMGTDDSEVKVRNLSGKGLIILVISTVCAITSYCMVLKLMGGSFAFVDATSTVLSAIATILMVARYSEQWVMWIIVNVVSVVLWAMAFNSGNNGGITMLVMWTAYLFNSVYGLLNWRKMAG